MLAWITKPSPSLKPGVGSEAGSPHHSQAEVLWISKIPCAPSLLVLRRIQLRTDFAKSLLASQFQSWLPPTRVEVTGKQLRNQSKLLIPQVRTECYKRSPIFFLMSLINKYICMWKWTLALLFSHGLLKVYSLWVIPCLKIGTCLAVLFFFSVFFFFSFFPIYIS